MKLRINIRLLCLFFCIYSPNELIAQKLFKSFDFQMPQENEKKNLKEEGKKLRNIAFGSNTSYAVRKKSLVCKEEKLVNLNIGSKKNLSLKEAENYLKKGRVYFESENFKTVYAQKNWSNPILLKKNLPCIRFVNPENTVVVEMYPRGQGSVYNVYVTFYNYDWFLKKARGEE